VEGFTPSRASRACAHVAGPTTAPWSSSTRAGGSRAASRRTPPARPTLRRSGRRPRARPRPALRRAAPARREVDQGLGRHGPRGARADPFAVTPTEEGRLLGHVRLGLRLIEEQASEPEPDALAELLHAVAAHHDSRSARTSRGRRPLPREPARYARGDETWGRVTTVPALRYAESCGAVALLPDPDNRAVLED
jgi:hypothetical protein